MEPDSDDAFSAEEYLSEFLDWLETSPYQQDDRTEIYEEWKEMLSTDQKYLIDFHKGEFENGSYLDVSYNTDYAKQSFESLVKNHNEFIMNQITGKDFKWYDISEIIEDIDEDDLETLTGTFFDGINVRHVQKERGVDS